MGCVKLHILDEQYKCTELKISYFNKELTLNNSAGNLRRCTLVRFVDPTGMDWYEAENSNVMWRKSQDKEYIDDDGNVWKNIGREYLIDNILFQQQTNKDGDLVLFATTNEREINRYKKAHESTNTQEANFAPPLSLP